MRKIMVDQGFLTAAGTFTNSENTWKNEKFIYYFGGTLGSAFDNFKTLTFEFYDYDTKVTKIRNGFSDFSDFETYVRNELGNTVLGEYHNIGLKLYLEIDDKISTLDVYAKNALYGALQGRSDYRKGRYIQSGYPGFHDLSLPTLVANIWNNHFSDNMTSTFITNNTDMKMCIYTRDGDRTGVIKDGLQLQGMNNSTSRLLFNTTDSDIPGNTLVTGQAHTLANLGNVFSAGSDGNNPRYMICENSNHSILEEKEVGVIINDFYRLYKDHDYSAIHTTGFRFTSGGKEYHALFISPIGMDTVYFNHFDTTKYRILAIKKANNSVMSVRTIDIISDGIGNKIGRVGTARWTITTSDDKNVGSKYKVSYHFVLQDIASGKCSNLSGSKMELQSDVRFRFPFYTLVS